MSREIKFRGIPIFGNAFVYGDLIQSKHENNEPRKIIKARWDLVQNETEFEVKTETVGQFTGFKDKNEKPIYEGDIVEWQNEDTGNKNIPAGKGFIKFHPEYLRFDIGLLQEFNSEFRGTAALLSDVAKAGLQICGNVFEHPNLINN